MSLVQEKIKTENSKDVFSWIHFTPTIMKQESCRSDSPAPRDAACTSSRGL